MARELALRQTELGNLKKLHLDWKGTIPYPGKSLAGMVTTA